MVYKKIVCLANSRKLGGRCVAGKDIDTRQWIRPVGKTAKGELALSDINYENKSTPQLLDIIKISIEKDQPVFYQPENVLIGEGKWEFKGKYKEDLLERLCDNPKLLWQNEPYKDRISLEDIKKTANQSSLLLIKVKTLIIRRVNKITEFGTTKNKVRGVFTSNNIEYDLGITDIKIEDDYRNKNEGDYPISSDRIFLCISLGEPFGGYCYKLIASVICLNEQKKNKEDKQSFDILRFIKNTLGFNSSGK